MLTLAFSYGDNVNFFLMFEYNGRLFCLFYGNEIG